MIKTTAFAYCVVLLLPVSAADILVNGDFSDGIAHWKGDGRNASDTGVDDMGSLSRPAGGNGMIITLKPDRWTKIYQEFDTKEAALDFHLSYKLSPDISTSGGRGGLANPLSIITGLNVSGVFSLPEHMERGGPASTWVLVVADPDNMLVSYVPIEPKAGMAESQTASGSIPHLLVHENKTLYLAFPPGTGTATIENIALTPSVPITVPPAATPSSPPSPPPDPYPFPNAKDNLLSSDGWSGNVNEANDDDSAGFPGQPAKLIWPLAAKLRSHALQYLAHPFHATTFPLMIWIDATPSSQNYDDVFHFKVRDVLHQYEKDSSKQSSTPFAESDTNSKDEDPVQKSVLDTQLDCDLSLIFLDQKSGQVSVSSCILMRPGPEFRPFIERLNLTTGNDYMLLLAFTPKGGGNIVVNQVAIAKPDAQAHMLIRPFRPPSP